MNSTSLIEARIVSVRSCTTLNCVPAGKARRKRGKEAVIRSAVATILAPGWRLMSMIMAVSLLRAPLTRVFSSPSSTSAMSRNSTLAPLRVATTTSR